MRLVVLFVSAFHVDAGYSTPAYGVFGPAESVVLCRRLMPQIISKNVDYAHLRTLTDAQFTLTRPGAFSVVSIDSASVLNMFFCRQVSSTMHAVDGWITIDDENVGAMRAWHKKAYPGVVLVGSDLTPQQTRAWMM